MFANPQQIREITCPEKHSLVQTDDLCQLYEGQSYTENVYFCDLCRAEYNTKSFPASHCKTCGFDLCPNCYEAQKLIQINCPQNQSHTLLKVRALQEFSNYASNSYGCQSCGGIFDSSIFPSAHCRACGYDLCPDCFGHVQLHILDPQQSQINYQPPHQINMEQSQPQSQPQTISYAPQQEEEQPKRWLNSTFTRFVACPSGHALLKENELKRMGFPSGGILAPHSYICRTCNTKVFLTKEDKYSCKTCFFDICPNCYNDQKKVEKMLCPKSHGFMIVRTLKEFANYQSNNYGCNACGANLDSTRHPAAHCSTCKYDLCPNCVIKDNPQENKNNGILQQVTCPSRHNLSPVNNLAQLPNAAGIYVQNMYNCDTCLVTYNCAVDPSHHCQTCAFDICPSCYQKAQRIYFQCHRNHPLYIVSNLKANHEGSGSYADNSYVCQVCQGSWDAAFHPSCHCAPCKFDLCPTCFEARNVPSLSQSGVRSLFPPIIQNPTKPEETKSNQTGQTNQTQPRICPCGQGQQNRSSWTQNQSQPRICPCGQGQQNHSSWAIAQTQPRICPCGQGQQNRSSWAIAQTQPRTCLVGQQTFCQFPQQQTQPRLDLFTGMPQGQSLFPKPEGTQTQQRVDFLTKMPLQLGQQTTNQLPQQQTQPRLDLFTGMPLGQVLFPKPEESKSNQIGTEKKEPSEEILCVLCLNDKRSYLFNPCNHLCACEKCAIDLLNKRKGCPICRNPIQSFTKVFMS